ncbi:hypothetical protein DFH29DRAFT_915675 [Suillus ampliporus]|nr:hypothetical protein DFH29DRAFT_915675 [Suillus ampliporus]
MMLHPSITFTALVFLQCLKGELPNHFFHSFLCLIHHYLTTTAPCPLSVYCSQKCHDGDDASHLPSRYTNQMSIPPTLPHQFGSVVK